MFTPRFISNALGRHIILVFGAMRLATVLVATWLVSACANFGMPSEKSVSYSDGLVTFQLPGGWLSQVEKEGNGLFFNDVADSNALRLSVISIKSKTPIKELVLKDLLSSPRENETIFELENGNLMKVYVKHSVEDGSPITTRFWELAHIANAKCARLAIFS